jgi:non-heme chloroperoxidase
MDISIASNSARAARPVAERPAQPDFRRHGPFIETDDGTLLFHKDWGTGRPVLFLHSWSVHSDMWDYQMVALRQSGLRLIAYDRRGHGRSSQPGGGYDFDTLADDLATVIDTLDLDRVTLVGHSMSCGEIIRYLTRHGAGRIARIALLGPTLPFMQRAAHNPDGIDPAVFYTWRSAWRKDFPQSLADIADAFFVPETSPAMRRWLLAQIDRCSLVAAIDCNVATTETDFTAELPGITVPALILHGDKDVSVPLALARKAARLIPDCRLEVYEGAPHGLFLTHMERVNADLAAFIGT